MIKEGRYLVFDMPRVEIFAATLVTDRERSFERRAACAVKGVLLYGSFGQTCTSISGGWGVVGEPGVKPVSPLQKCGLYR